eukprot:3721020-Lingulodinium_polyedra.AAC.1
MGWRERGRGERREKERKGRWGDRERYKLNGTINWTARANTARLGQQEMFGLCLRGAGRPRLPPCTLR